MVETHFLNLKILSSESDKR